MIPEDDFGFTFLDENNVIKKLVPHDTRAEELRELVLPFLLNLKKNPEKDIIQWPGKAREKSINDFIAKMNKLVDRV